MGWTNELNSPSLQPSFTRALARTLFYLKALVELACREHAVQQLIRDWTAGDHMPRMRAQHLALAQPMLHQLARQLNKVA